MKDMALQAIGAFMVGFGAWLAFAIMRDEPTRPQVIAAIMTAAIFIVIGTAIAFQV